MKLTLGTYEISYWILPIQWGSTVMGSKIITPQKLSLHSLSLFLSLADSLLDNGHCSYIDHWYTSVEIWDILNEMCWRCRHTSWPKRFTNRCWKKEITDLWTSRMYEHRLGLAVTRWKDKRDIFVNYLYRRWRNTYQEMCRTHAYQTLFSLRTKWWMLLSAAIIWRNHIQQNTKEQKSSTKETNS